MQAKAETEIRKLRQSFCFKARPLPEFYKERKVPKIETDMVSFFLNFASFYLLSCSVYNYSYDTH